MDETPTQIPTNRKIKDTDMKIQTIPTKYGIGDKPWLMTADNCITQGKVIGIQIRITHGKATEIEYLLGYNEWGEYNEWYHSIGELYDTKEELIKSL